VSANTSPVLTIDGLTTGYLKAPVLRDVSLEVGDEIVAVLGANGAGKTTLLRAISGALRAWSGSIVLDGVDLGRSTPWSRVERGIAHVPEGRHVFTAMTVEENLDVAALVAKKRGGARRAAAEVYELFPRLGERRDQLAGSMSGGEQQMLAIGRALMTGPRALLIDELSAGLAPVTARGLVDSLGAIRASGVAVLLVEQSPRLIADIVDRVHVLEQGVVTRSGSVDDIGGVDGLAGIYLARSGA
jgi:branched-chain amino acid transport system ATP-binding protein